MDTKNVIAAISLSAAVIVLYSLFFQPDPTTIKKNVAEQKKIVTYFLDIFFFLISVLNSSFLERATILLLINLTIYS